MKRNLKSPNLIQPESDPLVSEKRDFTERKRSNSHLLGMIQSEEDSTEGGVLDDLWDWIKTFFEDDKDVPTPQEPTPEYTPNENDLKTVEEQADEIKQNADPVLAMRATQVHRGDSGAIIGQNGPHVVKDGPDGDAKKMGTIPDGKPIDVIEVSHLTIKIKYRDGEESKKGWVLKSLFSPQPDLNRKKTESGEVLQDDYLYTLLEGDQSPQGELSGEDVEQGALADCFFIGAMQAVGSANPDFLEQAITYNASTGIYKVRFFEDAGYDRVAKKRKMKPHYELVDGYIPMKTGQPAYAEATVPSHWGPIVEKAYAQWKGGYDTMGRGGSSSTAMTALTGVKSVYNSASDFETDEIIPFFKSCQEEGKAVICGSQNSMKGAKQTPFAAETTSQRESNTGIAAINNGPYKATLTLDNPRQKPKPSSITIVDKEGNVARADDSHADIMDKQSDLKGRDVETGEVDYKGKTLTLTYSEGKGPASESDLEVNFRYQGLISPEKKVFAWHAYVFKHVTENNLIQLQNPWGSWHPNPLTAEEFCTFFSNMSENQVPQAESMDETVSPKSPDKTKVAPKTPRVQL